MNNFLQSNFQKYYPICIDINNRPCLVVGGGKVGERKVEILLEYGASVTVISKTFTQKLLTLAANNKIKIIQREFKPGDEKDAFLIICATNNEKVNEQIYMLVSKTNKLINVVDKPNYCNFIVPSIIKKGPINIAISTSKFAPIISKLLRKKLELFLHNGYVFLTFFLNLKRNELKHIIGESKLRQKFFNQLINNSQFLNLFLNNNLSKLKINFDDNNQILSQQNQLFIKANELFNNILLEFKNKNIKKFNDC